MFLKGTTISQLLKLVNKAHVIANDVWCPMDCRREEVCSCIKLKLGGFAGIRVLTFSLFTLFANTIMFICF